MPSVEKIKPKAAKTVLSAAISTSATELVTEAGLVVWLSTAVQVVPPFWLRHRPARVAAYTSCVPGCTTSFCV